jgi:conjugative relaxase-like TrwC/TraI family protein
VLKLHVVRGDGVDYHLADLGHDGALAVEGPGVAGESPGEWAGRGSDALGLRGAVRRPDLAEVLAGRHPTGGGALRQVQGARPVCGFDLVFAAPKAVSLLHLLAPRELGAAAGSAHTAAVADAVAYLEGAGLGVRRSRGGQVHHLGTTGAVAAGFVHRTSRTLDPHLHSHVVTANVAQGLDGRWSSLDSRRLFLHRRATQAVYDASLRHHLTRSAGVAWRRGATGPWEVVGVDPVLCRLFSQRAASIDESSHRRTGGRGSPGVRRVAYFADRPDKDRDVSSDDLRSAWRRRAASMGIDVNDLVSVVGRAPLAGRGEELRAGDVVEGLVRSGATRGRLTARDHVTAVADAAPQGLDGRDVVRLAGAVGSALGSRRRDDGPGSWSGAIDPVGRVPGVARGPGGDPAGPVRTPPGDGPGRRTGRAPGDGSAPGVRPPLELGR